VVTMSGYLNKKAIKWLGIVAVLGAALLAGRYWLLRSVRASLSYCMEAEFARLPPDDDRLVEWLKVQPGVVAHTVLVRRFGGEGKQLEVGFLQVRSLAGDPPFPDLDRKCRELGYRAPDGPFRDCKDRYR
jgi:hypothetical protein